MVWISVLWMKQQNQFHRNTSFTVFISWVLVSEDDIVPCHPRWGHHKRTEMSRKEAFTNVLQTPMIWVVVRWSAKAEVLEPPTIFGKGTVEEQVRHCFSSVNMFLVLTPSFIRASQKNTLCLLWQGGFPFQSHLKIGWACVCVTRTHWSA